MGNEASRPGPGPAGPPQAQQMNAQMQQAGPPSAGVRPVLKPQQRDPLYNMKVVLRGARGTGKTSLLRRLQGQAFVSQYVPTEEIQMCTIQWSYKASDDKIAVEVWDVVDKAIKPIDEDAPAGFAGSTSAPVVFDAEHIDVYKGAHCIVVLVDPRKPSTWAHAQSTITSSPPTIPVLVVSNFKDCEESEGRAAVSWREVEEWCSTAAQGRTRYTDKKRVRCIEASMADCYGLKSLYTYFNLPYLELKIAVLSEQVERAQADLGTVGHEVETYMAAQDYGAYVKWKEETKGKRPGPGVPPSPVISPGAVHASGAPAADGRGRAGTSQSAGGQTEGRAGPASAPAPAPAPAPSTASLDSLAPPVNKKVLSSFLDDDDDDDDGPEDASARAAREKIAALAVSKGKGKKGSDSDDDMPAARPSAAAAAAASKSSTGGLKGFLDDDEEEPEGRRGSKGKGQAVEKEKKPSPVKAAAPAPAPTPAPAPAPVAAAPPPAFDSFAPGKGGAGRLGSFLNDEDDDDDGPSLAPAPSPAPAPAPAPAAAAPKAAAPDVNDFAPQAKGKAPLSGFLDDDDDDDGPAMPAVKKAASLDEDAFGLSAGPSPSPAPAPAPAAAKPAVSAAVLAAIEAAKAAAAAAAAEAPAAAEDGDEEGGDFSLQAEDSGSKSKGKKSKKDKKEKKSKKSKKAASDEEEDD